MEDRGFKGIWIPAEIWLSDELSLIEKVLFVEIDSLDRNDGCFATNDYFMKFFGVSESTITRSIANLKRLGYIESQMIGGRIRILSVVKMTTECSQNDDAGSSKSSVSSIIDKNKNIKINNKSTGAGALSKNHHNIYKKIEKLEDKLKSGNDIDKQISSKKKSPKEKELELCLNMIDETIYNADTKALLTEYFEFVSTVPNDREAAKKVVRKASVWGNKLKTLHELSDGNDDVAQALIEQSLKNKKYVFYPLQSIKYNATKQIKEGNQQNLVMSDPEWARKVIQDAIDNGEEFY